VIVENIFLTQDVSQIAPENLPYLGLLVTGNKPVEAVPQFIRDGAWWILDNGAFTTDGFKAEHWHEWLAAMQEYKEKCICVVVPDVVADAEATIRQFPQYVDYAKDFGYRVAFVTQDGMTIDMLPWSNFDALFVGGTDGHKMGREAGWLIDHGLKIGKHIHVGRVNTEYRLMQFWQCHTWDGTALTIKPEKYEPIIINGIKAVMAQKKTPSLFDLVSP
jgi:hypothetical protein